MSYQIEVVSEHISKLGEAPFWSEKHHKLVYVDCFEKELCFLDPNTKLSQKFKLDIPSLSEELDFITVGIPNKNESKYLIAAMNRLYQFQIDTKELKLVYEKEGSIGTFNDGKCDPKGRLWLGWNAALEDVEGTSSDGLLAEGAHKLHYNGNLQCFNGKYEPTVYDGEYGITNGLAWTQDYKNLYWADFRKRIIWAYDFNVEHMAIGNKRVLIDYSQIEELEKDGGFPDGLVTDVAGNLWVACFDGGRIIKIDTSKGQVLETIRMPIPKVTSLCFGGNDYKELYVTSACWGADKVDVCVPNSGKIFRITSSAKDFKGFAQNAFVEEE